jgi:hypothetical protein
VRPLRIAAGVPALAAAALALMMAPLAAQAPDPSSAPKTEEPLNTLQELFDALGACWQPPPLERARAGTEITVRFSLTREGTLVGEPRITYSTRTLSADMRAAYQRSALEALRRCTPLRLSRGLGGAVAGRPISGRFLDDRDF